MPRFPETGSIAPGANLVSVGVIHFDDRAKNVAEFLAFSRISELILLAAKLMKGIPTDPHYQLSVSKLALATVTEIEHRHPESE